MPLRGRRLSRMRHDWDSGRLKGLKELAAERIELRERASQKAFVPVSQRGHRFSGIQYKREFLR